MTAPPGVRVLIVDDSPVAREVLKTVLEADAGIRVVGMAGTGHEAVELTGRLQTRHRDDGSGDARHGRHGSHASHHGALPDADPVLERVLRARRLVLAQRRACRGRARRGREAAARCRIRDGKPAPARWSRRSSRSRKSPSSRTCIARRAIDRAPVVCGAPRRHARGGDRRVDGRAESARRLAVVAAARLRPRRGRDPAHGRRFPSRHGRRRCASAAR